MPRLHSKARPPSKRELWEARDKAIGERDEARAFAERLLASRVLTCVYCGQEYPQGTPSHSVEILTQHIETCEKHPMRAVTEELRAARAELAVLKPVEPSLCKCGAPVAIGQRLVSYCRDTCSECATEGPV